MILKTASLTPEILKIIQEKETDSPFAGEYTNHDKVGTYLCRQCGLALFRSHTKFHSSCGWPSFDEEIEGGILQQPDIDGYRTEIICARCQGHLGHVFLGEKITSKNLRYCVNSSSLDFVKNISVNDTEEIILAAGCFWGVEYYFKQLDGVIKTEVGYTGGHVTHPNYEAICQGNTGHVEAVRLLYDLKKINFEHIIKYFFEIHDPTQADGQGPDLGSQYLSVVFYYNEQQQRITQQLINTLQTKDLLIATRLLPISTFWPAESYHQNYYAKTGGKPYCHHYFPRFD